MNKLPEKAGAARPQRGRPRTGARFAAVQALFQSDHGGESAETVIDQFVRHRIGDVLDGRAGDGFEDGRVPEADVPLFVAIVRAAAKNAETLDPIIARHLAKGWPLERLDPVLRALLRAAAAELWGGGEPPARVVITEYLDIAHGFFSGDEPRFASGVLDALAHTLRPEEFAARAAQPAR
ncbi:transcription antitermination factor NusB [Roseomonas sp. NAR14]|uniref:Transcription antitermination protein NusB n=1 Tax=Roseomonas acroporae TaxID=2937791 RepID=A0A9X1Y7V9_9PROT|nr:transcription antitermination factor NusB [Roseomonas acroporae]MCK8783845.1 transcription antitermination factor NusB [Roseomonas acroporae]